MREICKLIVAVENGEYTPEMFCGLFHDKGLCTYMEGANSGDIGDAFKLLDAVFPRWGANVTRSARGGRGFAEIWSTNAKLRSQASAETPARALLLSILMAMRDHQ